MNRPLTTYRLDDANPEPLTIVETGRALDAAACLGLLSASEHGCWFDRESARGVSLLMVHPTHVVRSAETAWLRLSVVAAAGGPGPFGFAGGWAGLFTYESAFAALGIGSRHPAEAALAYYPSCLAIDHRQDRTFAVGRGERGREQVARWVSWLTRLQRAGLRRVSPAPSVIDAGPTRRDFCEQVREVQEWIRRGDVYVANLTYRIRLGPLRDPAAAYALLRTAHPAPFAALLRDGPRWVLSSSPELLLARRGERAWTRPIKGTRAAAPGAASVLRDDPKERAELLMIVDMERNDLGRVARIGSVHVSDLFAVERHPGLHHLTATVEAGVPGPAGRLLRAMLPGGSVTGAPKRRAVELLAGLEACPRSAYTGTIGYCDDGGDMEWNVAIRTLECDGGGCLYGTGGGVTIDSDPSREYAETRLKARGPMAALGVALP